MDIAWHDAVGTLGVLLIVIAYGGLQFALMRPESLFYSAINGLGAALILVSLTVAFNFAAFLMEAVWLLLSVYGLAKALRRPA
jgi:paired small multidrug resistance pump